MAATFATHHSKLMGSDIQRRIQHLRGEAGDMASTIRTTQSTAQKRCACDLSTLPEELLEQIVGYVSFRSLRLLLHCGSEKLARLASFRLRERQTTYQSREGATEETKFSLHRPDNPPWPPIEMVGKMFLGKEFVLTNLHLKDDFVSQ